MKMGLQGSTAAMTQVQPMSMPAPSARSWWPLVGALALAVVVGAALLGSYGIVLFRLRHSPAGRSAVAQVRGSTQLQSMLGEPLHVWIEGGDLQHEGQASYSMRVRGSMGTAQVEVDAKVHEHVWSITRGTVLPAGAAEVPLDLSALAPPLPAAGSKALQPAPAGR